MKITDIKTYELKYIYKKEQIFSDALGTSPARQGLLIKIETDDPEIYGVGEAWSYGSPTRIQKAIIEDQLKPVLVNQDPTAIEPLYQKMYWQTIAHGRRGLIMGAISGIDIALWDILGKVCGLPIYKLLGGHSNVVPSYASGGFFVSKDNKGTLETALKNWVDRGYQVYKIKIGRDRDVPTLPLKYMKNSSGSTTLEEDLHRIEMLRQIAGNKKIIVDINAAWNTEVMNFCIDRLKEIKVDCIEEPYPFENVSAYKRLREVYPETLIMGFETDQNIFNFSKFIEEDIVDIVEPDIGWVGGFTATRKIASIAEAHYKTVSMHSFGSAVHFAASLQMAAAIPNVYPVESEENFNPLRSDITKEGFITDDKMNFIVSDKPGLGIEIDWNKVKKYKKN